MGTTYKIISGIRIMLLYLCIFLHLSVQMSLYCPYLHFSIFNLAFYLHYPSFPLLTCDIIVLSGCDEESEPAGQSCPFCDKDLSYAPTDDDEYEYTDILIDEPPKLPGVAVLSCGHFFHSQCLELNIPEELSTDPPCFLCLSYGERSWSSYSFCCFLRLERRIQLSNSRTAVWKLCLTFDELMYGTINHIPLIINGNVHRKL